jgi:hypothetical protein
MKVLRIPTLAVAAALALGACDDTGTGTSGLDRGEFDGDVQGEFSFSLNGDAFSGASTSLGQDEILLEDLGSDIIVYARHLDDVFIEGREQVADIDQNFGVDAGILIGDRAFLAYDGYIDVQDVSSSGIRGVLDFDAVEVDPVTGEVLFDEVRVRVGFITRYDSSCCGLFDRTPLTTLRLHRAAPKR